MAPDVFTPEKRSEIMRNVRSYDTKWEVDFRKRLWRGGLRYRVHYGPRKIDVAFLGPKVAVFLDSCFWHNCPKHRELPETNRDFWRQKLEGNYARDRRVTEELEAEGWEVLRLWSHTFVDEPDRAVAMVLEALARR